MQPQPPQNDVNALLKQEYRNPNNHLLQTSNILVGTVRLLVATARLTLVFSLLMLLAVHTFSPNTFSPLWTTVINDQRVAPIISIAPASSLTETDEVQDASLRASELEQQEYRDALAAFEEAIAQHTPPADDAAVMTHPHQALEPANAAPEAAPETVLYAQPISQPDYATRALDSSKRALHNLLTIAGLLALLACLLTNEGRFTWVYEDKAYAQYAYAHTLQGQYAMAKQATEHALENALRADQREGGI